MKSSLRRRLAYGSNATLVTLMVIGMLVVTYVIADLYRARWDFSADSANTIEQDTRAKLELLDAEGIEVTITAFTAQRGKDDAYFKNRAVKDLLNPQQHRHPTACLKVSKPRVALSHAVFGLLMFCDLMVSRMCYDVCRCAFRCLRFTNRSVYSRMACCTNVIQRML